MVGDGVVGSWILGVRNPVQAPNTNKTILGAVLSCIS